ncbi:hypothetical protein [Corynebacterium sp.]|uniref:hypothetical protein n=1 Tax=Corynebacterium sp. TaxID=1720 RepID=UPI0025B7F6ED|nr:hypothetical protein [Corynebacterium sp.]
MEHRAWIDGLIAGDSYRTAAEKIGTNGSTITRQLNKGHLSPEMVISLCRTYGRSPVTGLIETGYLNPWETEGVSIPYALKEATNKQILDEIMDRSDPEATVLFGGGDDVIDVAPVADVFPFPDSPRSFNGEQAEPDETTPSVRDDEQDLEEALRDANALRGAAQHRTPRLEEPEDP